MHSLTKNLYEATGTKCECGGAIIAFPRMKVCDRCGSYVILKNKKEVQLPDGASRFMINGQPASKNLTITGMEKYKIEISHGRYLGTKEAELFQEKKLLWFTFRIRKDFYRAIGCHISDQVKAWKELYPVTEIIDLT